LGMLDVRAASRTAVDLTFLNTGYFDSQSRKGGFYPPLFYPDFICSRHYRR
jgi:hypothetical protein